jgi:hypothetical protein
MATSFPGVFAPEEKKMFASYKGLPLHDITILSPGNLMKMSQSTLKGSVRVIPDFRPDLLSKINVKNFSPQAGGDEGEGGSRNPLFPWIPVFAEMTLLSIRTA